jgi:hypothetical protein
MLEGTISDLQMIHVKLAPDGPVDGIPLWTVLTGKSTLLSDSTHLAWDPTLPEGMQMFLVSETLPAGELGPVDTEYEVSADVDMGARCLMGRYWIPAGHGISSDEWLTPAWMLKLLGPFDLDPCAAVNRPWDVAETNYTDVEDGLVKPWHGRVWLNPPFSKGMNRWIIRLAQHRNGLGILPLRSTDTNWFHDSIWNRADAVLFLRGRVRFCDSNGEEAGPCPMATLIVAYGDANAYRLSRAVQTSTRTLFARGRLLNLWNLWA